MLLAVVVGVSVATLGIGGGAYYLVRSGRLPALVAAPHKAEVSAVPPATHVLALEPLLVNLADADGSSYLRIAMTLRVLDGTGAGDRAPKKEKGGEGTNEAIAPVRDTVLTVLGQQTSEELLASDGKEHLKTALKEALAEHNLDLKVSDVFFTDFLVQR